MPRTMNKEPPNRKDMKYSSVVNIPGRPYEFIAVGSEKLIYSTSKDIFMIPRPTSDNPNP